MAVGVRVGCVWAAVSWLGSCANVGFWGPTAANWWVKRRRCATGLLLLLAAHAGTVHALPPPLLPLKRRGASAGKWLAPPPLLLLLPSTLLRPGAAAGLLLVQHHKRLFVVGAAEEAELASLLLALHVQCVDLRGRSWSEAFSMPVWLRAESIPGEGAGAREQLRVVPHSGAPLPWFGQPSCELRFLLNVAQHPPWPRSGRTRPPGTP